jgi:drug/metabolite transporter (DMT)-like permease
MSILKWIGIFLILIGIAMVATGGFHFKEKKKVLDTDIVDISKTQTKIVTWPRIAGAVVVMGGIILLVLEGKSKVSSRRNTER